MQPRFDSKAQLAIVLAFRSADRRFDRVERAPRKRTVDDPVRRE